MVSSSIGAKQQVFKFRLGTYVNTLAGPEYKHNS